MLMCRPEHFAIKYEINPWMSIKHGAAAELALHQWQKLYQVICDCGVNIELVPAVEGLPDLVFTANCGLRVGRQIYLSRFKYPERQKEHAVFKQWFTQAGYHILSEPKAFFDRHGHYTGPAFEGAGDALFLGEVLFSAYGFRTDKAIYPYLCELFNIKKTIFCELVDAHFYHLDTCFCPLNDHQALWFPPAFSAESQQRMQRAAELFAIPAEEERSFACNAVIIKQHAIIPSNCPHTQEILSKLGFIVHECPMSEFIKSGGACKCLTFAL